MSVLFNDKNFDHLRTEIFVMQNKLEIIFNQQTRQQELIKKLVDISESLDKANENLYTVLTTLIEKMENKN